MSEVWSALTGGVVGVAIGEAGSTALEPGMEGLKQEAWTKNPVALLELGQLATLVAQALQSVDDVLDDAERQGYARDQLLSAIQLALHAPSPAEAERLYLRKAFDPASSITEAQLHHAYAKAGIEYQYWPALTAAAQLTPLTPAQLALGIVRSVIADPGLLVVSLDVEGSTVPAYPVAPVNAIAEAAAAGIDQARLQALVGQIGLPMSAQQAASAYFRGIFNLQSFNRAILEGDTRPEWAPFILDQAREIPSGREFVENRLRGYTVDDATLFANTAKWGMSEADTTLLLQNAGRPIPVHQITRGLAYQQFNPTDTLPAGSLYEQSLEQSNIKPPWFELAYAAERWTWPGYFVLEKLVPNAISEAEASEFLQYQGWRPDLADKTAAFFAGGAAKPKAETAADLATQYEGGTLAGDDYTTALLDLGYSNDAAAAKKGAVDARPLVSARTSLLSKLRTGVVGGSISADQATEQLASTTVAPEVIPLLVATWQQEATVEQLGKAPPAPPAA